MRLRLLASAALLISAAAPALSQTAAPPAASPPAASPPSAPPLTAPVNPVIAKVGGEEVHAADLADAAQSLPEELRGMPPAMLYPMLLDQMIDRKVIVLAARRQNLADDPVVKRAIARATDSALQNALLTREIAPTLTDEAIQARYQRDVAGKQGEEEIRASHILVADEDKAKQVIAELKAGAAFADLAKKYSTDPSAGQNSGDLGWFKKADMLPEFSDAAFALQPGQITEAPVKTRFGWHVIKLEERRVAPPPPLDQVKDEIRQSLIQEGVARVLAQARQGVAIEKFNQDGTPMTTPPAPAAH